MRSLRRPNEILWNERHSGKPRQPFNQQQGVRNGVHRSCRMSLANKLLNIPCWEGSAPPFCCSESIHKILIVNVQTQQQTIEKKLINNFWIPRIWPSRNMCTLCKLCWEKKQKWENLLEKHPTWKCYWNAVYLRQNERNEKNPQQTSNFGMSWCKKGHQNEISELE